MFNRKVDLKMFAIPKSEYIDKLDRRKGDLANIAYKKLKSSIYFDKTRLFLTKRIVEYEDCSFDELNEKLLELNRALLDGGDAWKRKKAEILESITATCFPKAVETKTIHKDECEDAGLIFVTKPDEKTACIKRTQAFIDMGIEGFVLGVVWVLVLGIFIDMKFDDHIKGNRLRKVVKENPAASLTLSPYLYEPYFTQYESWRDDGLNVAEQHIVNQKEGVAIITSDITSFYYSVDMRHQDWERIDEEWESLCSCIEGGNLLGTIGKRLNEFVEEVIEKYSSLFEMESGRHVMPIGFEPSPILSNLCLSPFDFAIETRISPLYYGRYVDDLILVVSSEILSGLSKDNDLEGVDAQGILGYVFGSSNASRFCELKTDECGDGDILISRKGMSRPLDRDSDTSLYVNNRYVQFGESRLCIKASKTNALILSAGSSLSLLDHFRTKIATNSSLFNLLPDLESLEGIEVFEEIYDFDDSGSPNKLGNLREMELNPFKLSVFLGKCKSIFPVVDGTNKRKICEEIIANLTYSDLIEAYTTWQRLFEVMCCSGFDELAAKLYFNILNAISEFSVELSDADPMHNRRTIERDMRKALSESLVIAFRRTVALCSSRRIESIMKRLSGSNEGETKDGGGRNPVLGRYAFPLGKTKRTALLTKRKFCDSGMVDRYSVAILPLFIFNIRLERKQSKDILLDVDLFDFYSMKEVIEAWCEEDKRSLRKALAFDLLLDDEREKLLGKSFSPYMVSIQEIVFALQIISLSMDGHKELDLEQSKKAIDALYGYFNYQRVISDEDDGPATFFSECFTEILLPENASDSIRHRALIVEKTDERKRILKVAVSNVRIEEDLLEESLVKDKYAFKYYQALCELIKVARSSKADMLLLPELSMPMLWIPALQRASAKNDLVIVCGLHYYRIKDAVVNLTATILPYKQDTHMYACVDLHKKVFFGPEEEKMIRRYGYIPSPGDTFTMYVWKDVYFPVYCCFELASPRERIAFSGYTDVLAAVEWNKDVNFYDHIISSLSRDMSCFCVQANNSIYGDSRIEQPKKTAEKTILRVSGGENWSVQVASLDIEKIRICQITNDGGKEFKAPAPDLDHGVAQCKINGRSPFRKKGKA